METKSVATRSVSRFESHLGYWMRRVSNAVSVEFARSLQARQTSVAEWALLCHLQERGQTTPGELADALAVTRGAISKVVDKLQAKGWIKTRVNPQDSRGQHLSLTSAGRRALPELAQVADRNDDRFFACLDKHDRSRLRRLLIELAEHHQIHSVPIE